MSARAWRARREKAHYPVRFVRLDQAGPPVVVCPTRAELARRRRLESLRRRRDRRTARGLASVSLRLDFAAFAVALERANVSLRRLQDAFGVCRVESALPRPTASPGPLQESFDRDYHYPRDLAPRGL